MTEKAQAELNARFIQGAITILGRSDNGAWHRAIEIARRLVAYGLWDGESRIEFDAYALHDRMFGVAQVSPLALVEGKDYRFPDRATRRARKPAKIGPAHPNLTNRRTSIVEGRTRYEIAWTAPDGEALASLYVTKGMHLVFGLTPDRARIELVGGSVVADGEGNSARAAYRAADRSLRLFRQDPADLLRKLALAEQQANRLQQSNDELRAHLAQLLAEQASLVRNFAFIQRQAEQQAANSTAVISRLTRLLDEQRQQRATIATSEAVRLIIYDPSLPQSPADAAAEIASLVQAGWRADHMAAGAQYVSVLMINPRAQYARKPPSAAQRPARPSVTVPPPDEATYQDALSAPPGAYSPDELRTIADREALDSARTAYDAAAITPISQVITRLSLGAPGHDAR